MRSATVIERLTRDANADVRANAAEALASIPDERTLYRLLADESWVVRARAAKVAGVTGPDGPGPRLAELLEDGSWWVRQNATLALAALGAASVPRAARATALTRPLRAKQGSGSVVRGGYVSEQLKHLDGRDACDGEAAQQFLIDLGRAEGLATIEAAARCDVQRCDPGALDRGARGDRDQAVSVGARAAQGRPLMKTPVEILFVGLLGYFLALNSLYLAITAAAFCDLRLPSPP